VPFNHFNLKLENIMKHLRQISLGFSLALALSVSAFAGELQTPGIAGEISTPGITGPQESPGVMGEIQTPGLTGDMLTPGIRLILAALF
jgi:hypothetical protein